MLIEKIYPQESITCSWLCPLEDIYPQLKHQRSFLPCLRLHASHETPFSLISRHCRSVGDADKKLDPLGSGKESASLLPLVWEMMRSLSWRNPMVEDLPEGCEVEEERQRDARRLDAHGGQGNGARYGPGRQRGDENHGVLKRKHEVLAVLVKRADDLMGEHDG